MGCSFAHALTLSLSTSPSHPVLEIPFKCLECILQQHHYIMAHTWLVVCPYSASALACLAAASASLASELSGLPGVEPSAPTSTVGVVVVGVVVPSPLPLLLPGSLLVSACTALASWSSSSGTCLQGGRHGQARGITEHKGPRH